MDRLVLASSKKILEGNFNSSFNKYEKIYNGFPGNLFPVITRNSAPCQSMHWGYYHPRLKRSYLTISSKNILYDKRFQLSIRTQKCLIPVNCFSLLYKGLRFIVFNEKARLFSLAGLYTEYVDSEQIKHRSFGVLTTPASGVVKALGQWEEPLIIERNDQTKWLNDSLSFASSILNCNNNARFCAYPISHLMNDISVNTKEVLMPIGDKVCNLPSGDWEMEITAFQRKKRKMEAGRTMEERAAFFKEEENKKNENKDENGNI